MVYCQGMKGPLPGSAPVCQEVPQFAGKWNYIIKKASSALPGKLGHFPANWGTSRQRLCNWRPKVCFHKVNPRNSDSVVLKGP